MKSHVSPSNDLRTSISQHDSAEHDSTNALTESHLHRRGGMNEAMGAYKSKSIFVHVTSVKNHVTARLLT